MSTGIIWWEGSASFLFLYLYFTFLKTKAVLLFWMSSTLTKKSGQYNKICTEILLPPCSNLPHSLTSPSPGLSSANQLLMCLTLQKAKTENVRVWSKERLIDSERANWEDGSPSGTSNPSYESTEFRLLLCQGKGRWEGQEVTDHCRHLGAIRKIVLVDVSLVTRFPQIFDAYFPYFLKLQTEFL